jgi:CheY-like chemotaxis protein
LIIDDEATDRRVMRWLAESCGFVVREALSLREMAAILQGWTPEVLVLDVVMPEADGIEIMSLLSSMNCRFSVLLVSACRSILKPGYDLGLSYGLHMLDAIAKPLDVERFKETLRRSIIP